MFVMQVDETIVVSPVALRTHRVDDDLSPNPVVATPRTTLRLIRQQSRSRPLAPTRSLEDGSSTKRTPPPKELPDGLIKSPMSSPPPCAWEATDSFDTQPRRVRSMFPSSSCPRSEDDASILVRHVCEIMLASPPPKMCNGHVTESCVFAQEEVSMLKQRQMHRIQQLHFEHPSINTTPQRLEGTSKALREILNSNATSVKYTPKPPPKA